MAQSILLGSIPPAGLLTVNKPVGFTLDGLTLKVFLSPSAHSTDTGSKKVIGRLSSQEASSPCLFSDVSHDLSL
jgi:hypothetical protein